jgi:dihydrodipicolinate synthase/N-acetylneuraminate lyase
MAHEETWREKLRRGVVIPAHPLALDANRKLDERRQRALTRYYLASGAGGVAVGVHTTQFEIRDPRVGLFQPVLALAMEELRATDTIRIAGIVGATPQAVKEAELAARCGYHAGLLSLAALRQVNVVELIEHVRAVASVIPVFGFYLQPAVGGRVLPYEFWRRFAEIENVVAIKMAPFNRYQTMDVVRAVAESGRAGEIALYTGNDDMIVVDLLTPFRFGGRTVRVVGGLLGHWAVWTLRAVELLERIHKDPEWSGWLARAAEVTDSNSAFFDTANNFAGCIAGLHEVLRRQGLLAGRWCLNPAEDLSPGQMEEIERIYAAYPHLHDDDFVRQNLGAWLK